MEVLDIRGNVWIDVAKKENVLSNKLKEKKSGNVGDVCGNVWISVAKM